MIVGLSNKKDDIDIKFVFPEIEGVANGTIAPDVSNNKIIYTPPAGHPGPYVI
jgi:hypothetical protein